MYDVAAMPIAAKPKPMSTDAGSARIIHAEWMSPKPSITTRNAIA